MTARKLIMKRIKLMCTIVCITYTTLFFADIPGISTQSVEPWLASGSIDPAHKKLINSVKSYPSMGTYLNEDGTTHTAHQYINNRGLNGTLPPEIIPTIRNGKFSVMRGKKEDFTDYPSGAVLFPDYPTLATKFDDLIKLMVTKPIFKTFFNKVHLNILNELYEYLMNIYTNFNLQHVGIIESGNTLTFNIPLFLQNEADYDANKKTLIINHLINIIESQMNGKIKSIIPDIPHLFATAAGKTLIQNDYSIDLTQFMIKQLDPGMAQYKTLYIQGLATYLSFFQEFTSYLNQAHPQKSNHFTAFVHIAETINQYIYSPTTENLDQVSASEERWKNMLKKMNPPLFIFNYDDIRALKLLPHLAKSLSQNSKSIGWPSHIVAAAEQQLFVSGHPIAYFKDDHGNVVKKEQATHLYVVLQSGANYFQEELLAQPNWLNKENGIINVIRGCFGDFSALLGLNIMDPCMETLIQNAHDALQNKPVHDSASLTLVCKDLLQDVKDLKIAHINKPETSTNQQSSVNNLLQNQLSGNQQTSQLNNLLPSANDLTPSSASLTPSDNNLSPLNDNVSASSDDLSDALNQ